MPPSGDSARSPDEEISIHANKGEKPQHDPAGTTGDHSDHVLDINALGAEGRGLKTARDGKTVLIPQPSGDPNDPLNWSPLKKHAILLVIAVVAFSANYASTVGIVTLLPQAMYVAMGGTPRRSLTDKTCTASGPSLRTPFNITWLETFSASQREDCSPCFCPPTLADCRYCFSSFPWP